MVQSVQTSNHRFITYCMDVSKLRSNKPLLIFVLLLVFIPVITFLASKVMNIQKTTSVVNENPLETQPKITPSVKRVELYFTQSGTTTPVTNLSTKVGSTIVLNLYANTPLGINGVDITLEPQQGLILETIAEGTDVTQFSTPLFNDIKIQRFAKITFDAPTQTGLVHIATFTFRAQTIGEGKITVKNALFTTLEISKFTLLSDLPSVSYTITR